MNVIYQKLRFWYVNEKKIILTKTKIYSFQKVKKKRVIQDFFFYSK